MIRRRQPDARPPTGADFYQVLGVRRSAADGEIRAAYRKLAQRWHPDRPTGDLETYQRIQRAYDVLSDDQRRRHYDEHGDTPTGPHVREAAMQTLCTMLTEAIVNPNHGVDIDHHDLVGVMRKNIVQGRSSLPQRRKDGEENIRRIERTIKRLRRKPGGDDILRVMLEQQIKGVRAAIENLKRDDLIGAEMLKILEDYTYKPDTQQATQFASGMSSAFGALFPGI